MSTAHARKNPDFLYPIRYGGRKEIFVVPFDQVIRAENEAILVYLLEHLNRYREQYPALDRLKNVSSSDRFTVAISFSQIELLNFLRGNSDHLSEDLETLKEIRGEYSMSATSRVRLDIALPHLLINHDVEKLYIVDSFWNEQKLKLIYELFKTLCNQKVFAVDGSIYDFVKETKEPITTIFTTSIEDIYVLTKESPDKVKDVYFLCSSTVLSNYEALYMDHSSPQIYKYHDWFETCREKQLCIVDFFAPIVFR